MGIVLAVAIVAIVATVASDIGFSVAEADKEKELQSALTSAQAAVTETNDFYQNVYKIVKTCLEHLKQSVRKLPPDLVKQLQQELQVNISDPSEVVQGLGYALGIDQGVVAVVDLTTTFLTSAGIASVDGVVAELGAVAGAAGAVLAVAGFGFALYNGITELKKLNHAIDKVNTTKSNAEDAMTNMKKSLDSLISAMGLHVGSYETLKEISDDWSKLAENFDKYSTAFCTAMRGFAMGKTPAQVIDHLKASHDCPTLKDDIIVLAKGIEENILQMMQDGKTDEQVISYYLYEHPHDGLHFQLDAHFVSTLRSFAKPIYRPTTVRR